MNTVQKNRLLKLAAFLIALPKQKFNYSLVACEAPTAQGGKPMLDALAASKESCGTAACAMGWTPAVFPRLFGWVDTNTEDWRGKMLDVQSRKTGAERDDAMVEIFGLTKSQVDHLFYPGVHNDLTDEASAKVVGRHIIKFVKWNEKRVARLKARDKEQASLRKQIATLESTLDKLQQRERAIDDQIESEYYDNDYPESR